MNDSKRHAEKNEDGMMMTMRPAAKRARFEIMEGPTAAAVQTKTNFIPTTTTTTTMIRSNGHRFLRLHLKLLKAMYFQETEEAAESKENDYDIGLPEQDGPMEEELCPAIERFLCDRGSVRALDAKVQHYEGLYEEAIDFIEEEERMEGSNIGGGGGGALAAKLSSMSPWSLLTPAAGAQGNPNGGRSSRAGNFAFGNALRPTTSLLFGGGSQQSPFVPGMYAHGLLSSHTAPSAANPFGLVAGLLQAKFHAALGDLQRTTNPFEPLVAEVGRRIEILEKLATGPGAEEPSPSATTTTVGDDDPAPAESNCQHDTAAGVSCVLLEQRRHALSEEAKEEWLARVETKLRLWRMLHSDLVNQ